MNDAYLTEQMGEFLMQASELAYVEGAQGTARLLGCMRRILRYVGAARDWVPFADEAAAVRDFMEIRRARFGNRIRLASVADNSLFLPRMSVLDAVMEMCSSEILLADPTAELELRLDYEPTPPGSLTLRVTNTSAAGECRTERRWTP